MKKVLLFAAAFLVMFSCSKNNNDTTPTTQKPTVSWEANPNFDIMEIAMDMNAKVAVNVPEKASAFSITLSTIPVELIGVANKLIGTQANKATAGKAGVLDLVGDNTAAQALKKMGFSSVVGTALQDATVITLDFEKLLEELAGDTPLANQSGFTFKIMVVDRTGNKLEKDIRFNWTSAPEISCTNTFPYELTLGTTTPLVLNIDAKGKIAGITIQFDGDAEPGIQAWIKNRNKSVNNGSDVIDLMKEGTATAFDLPAVSEIKDKMQFNLNLTRLMTQFSYEAQTPGTYDLLVTVVDALGKGMELSFDFSVPEE